jgi:DNA-binding transcriptional ArsR family regulator
MEKIEEGKTYFIAKTAEEVKMVFDPLRLRILETIYHTEHEMNVKEIATKIDEAANKVHYHVMKLVNFGVLKLVRTEAINGIIAKYYTNAYDGYVLDPSGGSKQVYELTKKSLYSNLDMAVLEFKKDMVSYMNLVAEQGKQAQRGLLIGYHKLYMTKEEKEAVMKQLQELLEQYKKEDLTKETYTMIQTIARIE